MLAEVEGPAITFRSCWLCLPGFAGGEIIGLRWRTWTLRTAFIHVREQIQRGEDKKPKLETIMKTEAAVRDVPIPNDGGRRSESTGGIKRWSI